ncbi:DUF2232 domain-containing protein [Rhizobium sp. C1]|uniref:DUF2232 domain-containing protein n=1 Tax=Rhizobium sp. C1 TaxID=1349799 RepID=UPI001E4A474E|nr:DUF2232 domain-containing protein [Rhizobium sp. C1]
MKMNPDFKSIAIGALAGLTSALLVLAATSHLSASIVFLILAGMPVFIAGLGFGIVAAGSALVASFLVLAITVSPIFALSILALPQFPAAFMSRLANFARPAEELGGPANVMAWYPLADMMMRLCALVAVAVALTLLATGYSRGTASDIISAAMKALSAQDPTFNMDAAVLAQVTAFYYYLLPLNQAVMSVITIFAAYYFSAIIVRTTTQALRPREDMPSALRMNRDSIYVLGVGLTLLIAGMITHNNVLTIVGSSISGAFGGGFLLAGLAAFHLKSRGKSWRMPALILAYLTISLTGIVFLIVGLLDTRRAIALTPVAGTTKQNQPTDNSNT